VVVACAALALLPSSAYAALDFEPEKLYGYFGPTEIAVGDFNGDGARDVAAASSVFGSRGVFLGSGDGALVAAAAVVFETRIASIAAADLNGDGRDDLAVLHGADPSPPRPGRIEPWISNGDGTFALAPGSEQPVGVDFPDQIVLGHLNGDDRIDAAVANGAGGVSVRLGQPGGFGGGSEVPTRGGGRAASVAIGDFTRDGVADLGIAVSDGPASEQGPQIAPGAGAGTFGPAELPVGEPGTQAVAAVDSDGDGFPELAGGTTAGGVSLVFRLTQSPGYGVTRPLDADGRITALGAGDLDGDGRDDLAATVDGGADADWAFIMRGDFLQGSVSGIAPPREGRLPYDIAIADFNGDGYNDVVNPYRRDSEIRLLLARRPAVSVPGAIDFGDQETGADLPPRTIVVRNDGTRVLHVGSVRIDGSSAFQIAADRCSGADLAPGGQCMIDVKFRPFVTGTMSARVDIGSSGAGAPHRVDLAGNAVIRPAVIRPAGPLAGRCVNVKRGGGLVAGTTQGDRLFGLSGGDVLNGLAGDDCINGEGGNDVLNGGDGRDTLQGSSGADRVNGDSGDDRASGGSGRDRVSGGSGNDRLFGSSDKDRLSGGAGNDRLSGGSGNDVLGGGSGRNAYEGGAGNDTINAHNRRRETVDCGKGSRDRATVDRSDRVRHCERVVRRR
jgi:hypothetical protein